MRILLADDEAASREAMVNFLKALGHEVAACANGEEALRRFEASPFSMALVDILMPKMTGLEFLRRAKAAPAGKNIDIVLVTGHANMQSAVEALRGGAYDYLQKPVNVTELAAIVDRIAEHQTLLAENAELSQKFDEKVKDATIEISQELTHLRQTLAKVVGIGEMGIFSPTTEAVARLARKLHADRDIPVLIEGETGTGKELIAKIVHYGDGEPCGPLVELNCSSISPSLFENELFGHEAGAFTGAGPKGAKGKLELAQGGTLFLDEIGDMPLDQQPKLLRVLEEKEFYRVGGTRKIKTDIRIVCATNRDLMKLIESGQFRKDLYYRLEAGTIRVTPLRERKQEIGPLAMMFLENCARRKRTRFSAINPAALRLLENHDWPGNVRELHNAIERVALLYDGQTVMPGHLSFLLNQEEPHPASPALLKPGAHLRLPPEGLDIEALNQWIIEEALKQHQGNKTHTAAYLGISRHVLLNRLGGK